jgi:hypothetical protein
MKTQQRIEKKGYKVIFCMGYKDGVQCITSVKAIKGHVTVYAKNLTQILKNI